MSGLTDTGTARGLVSTDEAYGAGPRARTGSVRRRLTARLGLRDRVTIGFGLVALVLSGLLAVVVGTLVSQYLMSQRQESAVLQTAVTAQELQQALRANSSDVLDVLDSIPSNDRSSSLLHYGNSWYTTALTVGPDVLPTDLVSMVGSGVSASQRISVDGRPYLAVGTPLQSPGDAYFELFGLDQLDQTYRVLSITLVAGVVVTAALGLLIGRFASRRALRPLARLADTASAVARGDLDARLDAEDDPDLGELARSFNQTTAALQRRVVADAHFAADVSHELRTPLTTMLNSMAVLANHRDEMAASLAEPLDLLAEDLERFRRLVVDLLEISRDEDEAADISEPVEIADLVSAAVRSAGGDAVPVDIAAAARVRVLADKRRLERIVVDLVENARVHGGGCTGVALTARPGVLRLTVDDAGPGVPPELWERVFDRFSRGRSGASSGGVGLGLAIVARHVRWHGGTVSVTDSPDGGARFIAELPLRRV